LIRCGTFFILEKIRVTHRRVASLLKLNQLIQWN